MRDDRDDPFEDIFREIERMMNDVMGGPANFEIEADAGFGSETHVDVHETDDEVRVVADLPGVEKEDIELRCDGEVLTVSARGERRNYDERVRLPATVDEHSASATYNNGVLEVTFQKDDEAADIDVE